jgi:transcription elongation factor Elf1
MPDRTPRRRRHEMAIQGEQMYGTYRCPVCGHRDAAEIDAEQAARLIECSYCYTALEVSSRGHDSVRFSVQVAEEPARG